MRGPACHSLGTDRRDARDTPSGALPLAAGLRPVLLLSNPVPIAVDWPEQSPRHGRPRGAERAGVACATPEAFEHAGQRQVVTAAVGPERIESGWWKEAYIRRDYYVLQTQSGSRYWIFKSLDNDRWFLHGVFG